MGGAATLEPGVELGLDQRAHGGAGAHREDQRQRAGDAAGDQGEGEVAAQGVDAGMVTWKMRVVK